MKFKEFSLNDQARIKEINDVANIAFVYALREFHLLLQYEKTFKPSKNTKRLDLVTSKIGDIVKGVNDAFSSMARNHTEDEYITFAVNERIRKLLEGKGINVDFEQFGLFMYNCVCKKLYGAEFQEENGADGVDYSQYPPIRNEFDKFCIQQYMGFTMQVARDGRNRRGHGNVPSYFMFRRDNLDALIDHFKMHTNKRDYPNSYFRDYTEAEAQIAAHNVQEEIVEHPNAKKKRKAQVEEKNEDFISLLEEIALEQRTESDNQWHEEDFLRDLDEEECPYYVHQSPYYVHI